MKILKLVYLVKRIDDFDKRGEFNIDATYKIVKYCYPLIVFGFSDVKRQFFPVAFMFTSHEETGDYVHFYASFKQLCARLKISFKPKYMMSDASKAMLKATKQCLPETTNLMCWFHLRMNIRKHKPLIGKAAYESVMQDISTLHNSTCETTFKLQLNSINSKWVKAGLVEFKEYFNKQWIKSAFNTRTPEIYVYLPDLKPLKKLQHKITKKPRKKSKKLFFSFTICSKALCFY